MNNIGMNMGITLVRFVLCLLLFASSTFVVQAGFGVSPPRIIEDNLVPSAAFERTIYLVQGDPEIDLPVNVVIESRDIKDWITVSTGESFTIPAGVQQFPVQVRIVVPDDANLGKYSAFIRINSAPDTAAENGDGENVGGQVSIALGGRIDVDLTVGDNVVQEYEVTSLDILDIGEGDDLTAEVRINNTGNVPASPDSATFELFDKFGNTRLSFANADTASFPRVPAFTEENVLVSFPLQLAIAQGEYWGHVKVFNETGQQLNELRTVFEVGPSSGLSNTSSEVTTGDEKDSILSDISTQTLYLAAAVLVGIVIVGGLFVLRMGK